MVVVCQRHGPYETENGYSVIYSALERRLLSSSQHGSVANRTPPGHRLTARLSGASVVTFSSHRLAMVLGDITPLRQH
jgi:hypothetical protein